MLSPAAKATGTICCCASWFTEGTPGCPSSLVGKFAFDCNNASVTGELYAVAPEQLKSIVFDQGMLRYFKHSSFLWLSKLLAKNGAVFIPAPTVGGLSFCWIKRMPPYKSEGRARMKYQIHLFNLPRTWAVPIHPLDVHSKDVRDLIIAAAEEALLSKLIGHGFAVEAGFSIAGCVNCFSAPEILKQLFREKDGPIRMLVATKHLYG